MKNIRLLVVVAAFFSIVHMNTAGAEALKSYKFSRPESEKGPTEIQTAVWLIDIDSIDSSAQSFVANVFVSFRWRDPRLAHGGTGNMVYNLNDIWNPTIQLANEIGIVRKTMPEMAIVDPEGNVVYRQRYIGPFSQPLNLENFPFDEQVFRLHFLSTTSKPEDIRFVRNKAWVDGGLPKAGGIAKNISLPDWKIVGYDTIEVPYRLAPSIEAAGYVFDFIAARDVSHYIWKVFIPLFLIVMMSWSVFWIDPSNAGIQIGVSTTSMLTLIAYRFAIDSQVPRVPYMTKLDQFIVVGTVLIFLSLSQVVLTSWLAYTKREVLARKIDRVSRYVFPIAFVIGLAVSLVA